MSMSARRLGLMSRGRPQRGLTLVELLVALILLGFIMTLVAEVVTQVSQVARAADAVTRGSSTRWGTGWSAGPLFANLLVPEEVDASAVLTGSTSRITGYSSRPLDGSELGIQRFDLELRPAPPGARDRLGGTELRMRSAFGMPDQKDGAVVAVYPGRAEFAFVDVSGQLHPMWPLLTRRDSDGPVIPQAIVVKDADSGTWLMWYGFEGETEKARPSLDFFGSKRP